MMKITGKMSEKGADEAKSIMAEGLKFLLRALGVGGGLALLFWQLPALADFILTLENC